MPITLSIRSRKHPAAAGIETTILVVPTRRRARHLVRELIAGGNPQQAHQIFTLGDFAGRLLQSAFPDVRMVEEPVLTLLFNQAINKSATRLTYFKQEGKSIQIPHGTFERIVNVIRRLKEVGVDPAALAEEIGQSASEERQKLNDIASIYTSYEEILAGVSGVDAEGVFKLLHLDCPRSRFEETFRNLFPEIQSIAIVGFDEFTEPEIAFIEKLCAMTLDISLVFDFQHGNPALFGHLENNYRRFLELGFSESKEHMALQVPFLGGELLSHEEIRHIASNLFTKQEESPKPFQTQRISVAKAKDKVREIELICKLIKHAVNADPSMDLSKICVAFYRPQAYTHIVREQFAKFGIPVNVTDRFELAQSPVVAAAMGLLEIGARNFRRDDVLRVLGSSYLDFRDTGRRPDRANLALVSLDLRITAGVESWKRKIERQITRLEALQSVSNSDDENVRRSRDINRLRRAQDDIVRLVGLIAPVRREQTPREFLKTFIDLLRTLDVERCITGGPNPGLIERDARAYARLLDVAEQMTQLLEYQQGKSLKHSLKFYIEQLKVALLEERCNVRETFGEGVLVTSIDETRGLPMQVMIVAGMVDGQFPSQYQSEIFFSAERLKEREIRYTWENRYLFYQAVTNWSDRLYLTYPEQDADLDLVRSSFVDALSSICEVEEWTYPGNSPFDDHISSHEEYLREYGRAGEKTRSELMPVPDALGSKIKAIEHAIRVERGRALMGSMIEYQGGIFEELSPDAREELRQLKHRVYSVSQLETYGKCPFQFLAKRLLQLNVVEDFEEEFTALEKGSVLHEILFEFYVARREAKLPRLAGCSEKEFEAAHSQLLEIAERKLAEIDIPDAFWELEKELILGDKRSGEGMLGAFLEFERERKTDLRPEYFEVGFGSKLGEHTRIDREISSEEPVLVERVQLRGKVDRVEVGDGLFTVIDYKTGSGIAKLDEMREGLSLQLPIYLYTMEKMLTQHLGSALKPAAGLYYQIRNRIDLRAGVGSQEYRTELGLKGKSGLLPSDEDLRALIDEAIVRVNRYVDEIAEGKFPLTTPDKIAKVCTFCDYKTICRIQSRQRVDKKKEE